MAKQQVVGLSRPQLVAEGLRHHQAGRLDRAAAYYRKALALRPDDAEALYLLGVARLQEGAAGEATELIAKAVAITPDQPEMHNNLGFALAALGRFGAAVEAYRRAIAIKPRYSKAHNNLGVALAALGRFDEALEEYGVAIALTPGYVDALSNRGNALCELMRHQDALASYDRALAINPDDAETMNNRGNALHVLMRREEALASYDRALALKPDYADAMNNRGNALRALKRYEEAAAQFERLRDLQSDYDYVKGNIFYSKLQCCDWSGYDLAVKEIHDDVAAGKRAVYPFAFLSMSDSSSAQRWCAAIHGAHKFPALAPSVWNGERYRHEKIRIAYLSADFHDHATTYLMIGLFEAHDRSRFETTAISFGPDRDPELEARLNNAFDRFIDVRSRSDHDVACNLRELEIDIAVDLKGYTQDSRPGILAFRPCPVQVNYLGYPGTMGVDYIDYILADRFVIPETQHSQYAEKVAYLPDSYQANDSKRRIGEHAPTRAEAGLPETGFVFCSFNSSAKISPPVFDIWMRLLQQVDGSVLWLLQGDAAAVRNLRATAQKRGVAPDRLVFAPFMAIETHLARHCLADLFLDCLPYNAHTTASDALWAGLPVVTCLGASFAGRVAASLLHAVGLPELIADGLEAYEALALRLARDQNLLGAIKTKLAENLKTTSLFATNRFSRHIESVFERMWARHQCGESPASFAVAAAEHGQGGR